MPHREPQGRVDGNTTTFAGRQLTPELRADINTVRVMLRGVTRLARERRLQMELSQAARARFHVPAEHDGLGYDQALVSAALARMERLRRQELIVLPSRHDPRLVSGRSGYVGGDRPNPYQWCPLLHWYTPPGGWVMEAGASSYPSCDVAAHRLGLGLNVSMAMLSPDSTLSSNAVRRGQVPPDQPGVVLVPLPHPMCKASAKQHVRLWNQDFLPHTDGSMAVTKADAMWDHTFPATVYPEFAESTDQWVSASVARVAALAGGVPVGTIVVVTARDQLGVVPQLDHALDELDQLNCVDKHWVYETPEPHHYWNHSPLGSLRVTVWRVA